MDDLRRYLARHHGVFTRAHARQFGFTDSQIRRRIERGDWERLAPRVYRLTGAPDTSKSRARASALTSRGLLTSTSGLRVWRVDGHHDHRSLHVAVDVNRLASAGYQLLSFTWDDFKNRPSELVAVVKAAYQSRNSATFGAGCVVTAHIAPKGHQEGGCERGRSAGYS